MLQIVAGEMWFSGRAKYVHNRQLLTPFVFLLNRNASPYRYLGFAGLSLASHNRHLYESHTYEVCIIVHASIETNEIVAR